jgi:hypothetical protein
MKASDESVVATWVFILILVLLFAIQSFLAYKVIGNAGQPSWSYGIVRDVPGESPYAIYPKVPYPQHVKGAKGE